MENLIPFLQQNWIALITAPPLLGIGAFLRYLFERKVEGRGTTEAISRLNALADLKEKMNKTGVTVAELHSFQAEALGKSAIVAVATAQRYVAVAEQLSEQAERAEQDAEWGHAGTQLEMNQISSNKATQADEELRTIFQQTLRGLEGDGVALLERSQMVWAQYREAEVEREGQIWNGGSIRPLMANLKYEAITRQRIAALASSGEGDSPPLLVDARAKTPLNLLEIIVPMVPQERVRGLLGAPTYTSGNRWQYRYEETQVEIAFNAGGAVEAVVVALCQGHQYAGTHPGENTDAPLGRMTLGDVIEHYPSTIEYSESLRTKEVYVRGRWGPPGAWTYYGYGALYVNTGVGHLQEVDFSWDKTSNQLVSEPKSVLINWMALMSSYGEPPGFDWFIKS